MQPSSQPESHPHEPLERIVMATDLGVDSPDLFAHGLKLALKARAQLFLLHVSDTEHPEATWRRLPTVRAMLERWGHISIGASSTDFASLGIKVHALEPSKVGKGLRSELAARIAGLEPDLLVLGTHARTGFDRLMHASVAEPVARDAHQATLLVPSAARGIVDPETGALALRRVLVPVTRDVPCQPVIDQLARMLYSVDATDVHIVMVHVGDGDGVPTPTLPTRTDWMWQTDVRSGALIDQLLVAEVEHEVDLIAMGTHGHDSFLDAVIGSKMERVLRRARCPVFAVPV